jgi:hypothetical protein
MNIGQEKSGAYFLNVVSESKKMTIKVVKGN